MLLIDGVWRFFFRRCGGGFMEFGGGCAYVTDDAGATSATWLAKILDEDPILGF